MMVLKILLLWLFLCFSYSNAEELNTNNLLNEADTWSQTGLVSSDTCSYSGTLLPGEVCFGHSNTRGEVDGGGTITSNIISLVDDGGLTVQELNQGFTINYGFDAESHLSNSQLPSCSQTTGDCRDIIDYTLTLTKKDGSLINKYNHYIELTYSGVQDYAYSQTIGENNYADVYSQVSIYGVDAGYTSGYYGAIISDPYFNVEYNTVVLIDEIIDIIDDVIEQEIIDDVPGIIEVEVDLPEIFDQPLEIEIDLVADLELPELDTVEQIEMIEVVEVVEPQAAEIEMEIEQEMEAAIEETIEETNDPQPDSVDAERSDVESEESTEQEDVQSEEDQESEEPRETMTADKKQEIKEKIVKKMLDKNKDRSDPGVQAQTMALMVVLTDTQAFNEYTNQELVSPVFYQDQQLPLQEMIPDPYSGLFDAAQNNLMNTLVNSQY